MAATAPVGGKTVTVRVNGTTYEREVEARRLLIHFLRDDLDLTGSHVGCDTGNCGACSVLFDGVLLKSCMLLAVQADGASIRTVEGLGSDGEGCIRFSLSAPPSQIEEAMERIVAFLAADHQRVEEAVA